MNSINKKDLILEDIEKKFIIRDVYEIKWSEEEFDQKTTGSPIRRTGYECWLRNLAIALGNAPII